MRRRGMDHGRAQRLGAQARAALKGLPVRCRKASGRLPERGRPLLGAAGGAGAAHIMQFRPVGIEGFGEELLPEGADLGKQG